MRTLEQIAMGLTRPFALTRRRKADPLPACGGGSGVGSRHAGLDCFRCPSLRSSIEAPVTAPRCPVRATAHPKGVRKNARLSTGYAPPPQGGRGRSGAVARRLCSLASFAALVLSSGSALAECTGTPGVNIEASLGETCLAFGSYTSTDIIAGLATGTGSVLTNAARCPRWSWSGRSRSRSRSRPRRPTPRQSRRTRAVRSTSLRRRPALLWR